MSETQSTKENSKVYEIGFHIAPIVGEEKLAYEVSEIKNLLEKIKAEIVSEDFPRLRALAYPLSKVIGESKKTFNEAYFGWIKFQASSETIAEFKNLVEKMQNILRFIIVKTIKDNTLHGGKFSLRTDTKPKREGGFKPVIETKQEVNETEVDKAIEELVV